MKLKDTQGKVLLVCPSSSSDLELVNEAIRRRVKLVCADFSGMNLTRASFVGLDMGHADFSGANLELTLFRQCNCPLVKFTDANLKDSVVSCTNLGSSDFTRANLRGVTFSKSSMHCVSLIETYCERTAFICSDLIGTSFNRARLEGSSFQNSKVSYCSFSGTGLVGYQPIFQIGPIGSRSDQLTMFVTEDGPRFSTGCQSWITLDQFRARLADYHREGTSGRLEYEAALEMCLKHYELFK